MLPRQGTVVGVPKGKKGKGRPQPLKKTKSLKVTSKRGAYKPQQKKNMMIRRAPFVETKSRTHEDVIADFPALVGRNAFTAYNTALLNMNPDSFLCMKQGLEENQMIGRAVFAKYLKMKISIRFPQPSFVINGKNQIIPDRPQRYYLLWGFVNSTNWTASTSPQANTATLADVHTHINQRLIDYFNDQKDYLRFIPKRASTLTIIGRRKVYPSKKYLQVTNSHDNVGADTITGVIPDFNTSVYWPLKKKIHYEKTNNIQDDQNQTFGFYPNYNRLPFCVLVNPDHSDLPSVDRILYCPQVAWNDALWYSDS